MWATSHVSCVWIDQDFGSINWIKTCINDTLKKICTRMEQFFKCLIVDRLTYGQTRLLYRPYNFRNVAFKPDS